MLHYALVFFIVAIIAAIFGFGGIAAGRSWLDCSGEAASVTGGASYRVRRPDRRSGGHADNSNSPNDTYRTSTPASKE